MNENEKKTDMTETKNNSNKIIWIITAAVLIYAAVICACIFAWIHQGTALYSGDRITYYNDFGLYEYRIETKKSVKITNLPNDIYDADKSAPERNNLADAVSYSEDGRYAYLFKNIIQTDDPYARDTATLYRVDLKPEEEKRQDEKIAEKVTNYNLTEEGLIYRLDNGLMYYVGINEKKDGSTLLAPVKVSVGVEDYYLDTEGHSVFYYTQNGAGYVFYPAKPDKPLKIADGIAEMDYVSDDMSVILYMNEDADLLKVSDLKSTKIIDNMVTNLVVIEKTGHAYYLQGTKELQMSDFVMPEDLSEDNSELPDGFDDSDASHGPGIALEKIKEDSGNKDKTANGEDDFDLSWLYPDVTANSDNGETGTGIYAGKLKYCDYESSKTVMDGVLSISPSGSDKQTRDRVLVEAYNSEDIKKLTKKQASGDYEGLILASGVLDDNSRIYMIAEGTSLDTGLNYYADDMIDIIPDETDDILYYIKGYIDTEKSSQNPDSPALDAATPDDNSGIQSEAQTGKEPETQAGKESETQTDKESETQTDKESETQTDKESKTQTDKESETQTDKESETQTDKESETQTDKESETQTDKESETQTDTDSDFYSEDYNPFENNVKYAPVNGTLYSMNYTMDGFSSPNVMYSDVRSVLSAANGEIFTVAYNADNISVRLSLNNALIADHVTAFFWDDSEPVSDVAVYHDVFYDDTMEQGKLSLNADDRLIPLGYGVSNVEIFEDKGYTYMSDYENEIGSGFLWYWDGKKENKPILIDKEVTASETGDKTN